MAARTPGSFPHPSESLVIVKWEDAAGDSSWRSEPIPEPGFCISVGWIVRVDPDWLLLSAAANDQGWWGDTTTIPRRYVREIRPLVAGAPEPSIG